MKTLSFLLSFFAVCCLSSEAFAANVICVNPAGILTVASKCKVPNSRYAAPNISALSVTGPQGPKGDTGPQGPAGGIRPIEFCG